MKYRLLMMKLASYGCMKMITTKFKRSLRKKKGYEGNVSFVNVLNLSKSLYKLIYLLYMGLRDYIYLKTMSYMIDYNKNYIWDAYPVVHVPLQSTPTRIGWCESDCIETRPNEPFFSPSHNNDTGRQMHRHLICTCFKKKRWSLSYWWCLVLATHVQVSYLLIYMWAQACESLISFSVALHAYAPN